MNLITKSILGAPIAARHAKGRNSRVLGEATADNEQAPCCGWPYSMTLILCSGLWLGVTNRR